MSCKQTVVHNRAHWISPLFWKIELLARSLTVPKINADGYKPNNLVGATELLFGRTKDASMEPRKDGRTRVQGKGRSQD